MVLRRGHARHKNVPDPLEAAPKRVTTIHAQRKFAQGMIRPDMSPIKEKEKRQSGGSSAGQSSASGGNSPAPSASPSTSAAKRPRTVDFINYLAFRPFLGTTLLPQPLKNFTVTTRPQKAEASLASSSSPSKQLSSPTRQEQDENKAKKAKQAKRAVMLSKSKVLDQRQRKTRLNAIVQKGASKVLKPRNRNAPIAQQHLKKVAAASKMSPKMQKLKGRPVVPSAKSSHPSILKRLGASKERAGLRSAGQLPPGSEDGIKTDRKPRSAKMAMKKHQSASILRNKSNLRVPLRLKTKQNAKRAAAAAAILPKLKRDRLLARGNLRAKNSPPNKSLNLAVRPSRKTKTAASLYMEMITKDLRSPDEDDESPEKSTESDAGSSSPLNTRQRRSMATSEVDSPTLKSSPKKGAKPNKSSTASPTPSASAGRNTKAPPAQSGKKTKVKKEDDATDSQGDEIASSKTSRKSSPLLKRQVKKSLKTESPEATSKVSPAKSTLPKRSGSTKKQNPVDDETEESSQSENDEDTGSRGNAKRAKMPQKSASLAKNAPAKTAKEVKTVGKNIEKDVSPKRSTRSAGSAVDPSQEVQPKSSAKGSGEKKAATASKKASRQTAKDSDTSNPPSDKLAKSASAKPAAKKAAAKDSDESESEDEEETSRPPSKSAKGSKAAKSIEKDGVEEANKKSAGKTGKRNANKAAQQQSERRSTRKPVDSLDESESGTDKSPKKRVTRKSNQLVKTKDKADESEDSDEEMSPKPKRTRRPVQIEKDDRNSSGSEQDLPAKSKKLPKASLPSARKASIKTPVSDKSEDEEMKPADSGKTLTRRNDKKQEENKPVKGKTKKPVQDDSAEESEDQVPAKRLKAGSARKLEPVTSASAKDSSEVARQNKAPGKKSSAATTKPKEEPAKKAVPKASDKAETEAETSTKRASRVDTPTLVEVTVSEVKVEKDLPVPSKKSTSAPKKTKEKVGPLKESVKVEDSSDPGKANKAKLTKDGKLPAKRGRKPKSLANQLEAAKSSVQVSRPSRTRRSAAVVKKESYSELSEVESEESDVSLPRTRGRNSNVKYTEKDSEDEESEDEMVKEMERRPRRSTRAVFCPTLGLDIESDFDDLDDFTALPIHQPKPAPVETKAAEGEENESTQNKTANKPSAAVSKTGVEEGEKKSDISLKTVADKKTKHDGNLSDSSAKKTKTLKSLKDVVPVEQTDIVRILENRIAAVDTKPISVPKEACKVSTESSKAYVALNGGDAETNKKPEALDSLPPEVKREQPRASRRLSKDSIDKPVELDLVLRIDESADDRSPPAKLASSRMGLAEKPIDPIEQAAEPAKVRATFELPNKEHYEDGLATLADVAFSELQSRKNIMDRKLSSDSATSFSSEDVLLPVRRDKIVPKAKADLPTVREKTESDEEISDVGNEETDEGSSFDEFRKSNKQFRRKRLPRRSRKEASRPQSRRPVRSVRLAADSYVDDDLSSSDRSSTPDLVQAKPVPKKAKKPDDKTVPKLQPGSAAVSNAQQLPTAVLSPASNATEPKKANDNIHPPAKNARDLPKPALQLKDDASKTIESSRTPAVHKQAPQQLVKVSQPNPVPQVELFKSHASLASPKDGACVDVRNNNSMTLFSGVSGVRVMKPVMSDRAVLGKPSPVKDAPRQYQTNQVHAAHAKVSNESPVKSAQSGQPSFSSNQNPLPKDHSYRTFPDPGANLGILDMKSKPNIGDTWKNAFINAKLPKPGQLSPAHHSGGGTPFVRKQFPNSSKSAKSEEVRPSPYPPATKLPGVQTFKASAFPQFNKVGSQSPNRMPGAMSPSRQPPASGPSTEPKGNVYLSPARVKGSPAKAEEKVEIKKVDVSPQKSLTLLQYEKRSQELISSLKDPQPVLLDGSKTYVQAYPTKLKEYSMEKARSQAKVAPSPSTEETSKTEGGKHLNLPFAVEQAFRKRSPITVKKPAKPPAEKKAGPSVTIPENHGAVSAETPSAPRNQHSSPPVASATRVTTSLDILSKKKVNMTDEEIKKWLEGDSPKGHSKDCGLFENNQCKCSYRTSSESMQNTSILVTDAMKKEEPKVDHGVVEPPVQLRELDSGSKFTAETISTCKVEDYKEKMFSKTSPAPAPEVKKELVPPTNVPKPKRPSASPADKSKKKSSMTEDEMCEFDFRFERTSNSPRESGSDMSSPTPRDDVSSSNDEKLDGAGHSERKSIFMPRRPVPGGPPATPKRSHLSKSPCAFSAENESSVYAFDDAPPPTVSNPFRRRGSRNRSSEDDCPIASSSIAVQVNIESPAASAQTADSSEQVLETSTQTDQNEGQLFYFPLGGDKNPQEVIQGVQVNLQNLQSAEGPEQSVIMKAKLVTKPSAAVSPPSLPSPVRPLSDAGRTTQRPEQKVRPLSSNLESSPAKPPVVSVQPTVRDAQPSSSVTTNSQGTTTTVDRPALATRSTQAAASPPSTAPSQSSSTQSTSAQESPPPAEAPAPVVEPAAPKPSSKSSSTSTKRSSPNEFPNPGTTPRMVDAPTFYPTEKEFQDPLEYFDQIMKQAQTFGICRIVPPASFKPECKVSDDMRFTAYNQYVHKMLYRWGPNVREMTAIKKYLATQSIALKQPPWIGGMEIDLPRLYQTVQSWGGLKEVIEKKRWAKVADTMKIPKAAQDRVTKLDDIYCKFLLPYDTLSHSERSKLLEEVDAEWTERERRIALEAERESRGDKEEKEDNSESEEESDDGRDECMTKGRTMPLSGFYRIARNTMAMWFKEPNPSAKEVENEYWKQVTSRKQHVCVNSGSIDSGSFGYGFPTSKSSSTARHPWNLKVLTNNSGSILRSLGPLMGVTVPTLHVGMLFSACCWYRDPHGLPWIEYAHTGANKIWYAVPDLWNEELHGAMRTILPRYCQDKPIWLASDTAMVPPDLLVQQGVSLCRAVQEPGQFILVFPKAFTSTICTGYIVSESVYFAQSPWLDSACQIFKDIKESCEQPAFSLERLIFSIATDQRSSAEVLTQILPMLIELKDTELRLRKELEDMGVTETERLAISKGRKKSQEEQQEYECEICRGNLYLSLVANCVEEANFCLEHSVETLSKDRSHIKNCKLMYSYDEEEMDEVIEKVKQRIEVKSCKKQKATTSSKS